MAQLVINHEKCIQCELCITRCPFNAMSMVNGKVETNAACKMCRICVKNCPVNAITVEEEKVQEIDKSLWQDILVYVEHDNESIHPNFLRIRLPVCVLQQFQDQIRLHIL